MYLFFHVGLSLLSASLCFCAASTRRSLALLPKPDGPYEVNLGIMELVDESRLQPFAPTAHPRYLMVSCFYPVDPGRKITPTPYMNSETALYEDNELSGYGLPLPNGTIEALALQLASSTTSRLHPFLPVHPFPVVLFQPAEGTTRLFYSAIASTIASKGYIVVAIDAPYDVDIVTYPNNSPAPEFINMTVVDNPTLANINLAVLTRAQDASFVIDQLANTTVVSTLIPGAKSLNTTHVGMFGHSLGGAAAAMAMHNDTRIAGGLDMDGALWGPVIATGLNRPFMFMAHAGHTRTNTSAMIDPYNSWFDIWPKLSSFKLDVIVANSLHYTFSDYQIVLETLNIVPKATVAEGLLITDLKGTRALKIITTYVGTFMDFVLKGKESPLLKGPSKAFPEVTFDY